jgi:circadian clock protein KaiB
MTSKQSRKKSPSIASATEEFERLLQQAPESTHYVLRLYVTGTTRRSVVAIANIRKLCEKYLAGQVELEVVDIYQQPLEAQNEQIIAAPTLVRERPTPPRRMVGDLSDPQKVLVGLDLLHGPDQAGVNENTQWIKL